jgi:hypothetical protein
VSFIVCVDLYALFRLSVVLFCVNCVICMLCLIVVPLPPGKNPFADKIIIKIIIIISYVFNCLRNSLLFSKVHRRLHVLTITNLRVHFE